MGRKPAALATEAVLVPPAPASVRFAEESVQERRQALRALLRHSLLSADGPQAAEFALVRRHAEWIRNWLANNPGWSLHVEREGARLRKTPADLADGTRPARDGKSGAAFTRRRYVLVCLALAALERSDRQTVLGKLADEILTLTAADPALAAAGIHFDLQSQDQRRDLVQVVRLLLDLRVLVRVQGDEQQYLAEQGDVLYSINRPALAGLLNVNRGPSTVEAATLAERLAAISAEPPAENADSRQRRTRARLIRRLLDDPVLYYGELDEEEAAYLQTRRGELLHELQKATGLIPEVRREGIALVDEHGDLTDIDLPEEGTLGHLTLLLAEWLAQRLRAAGPANAFKAKPLCATGSASAFTDVPGATGSASAFTDAAKSPSRRERTRFAKSGADEALAEPAAPENAAHAVAPKRAVVSEAAVVRRTSELIAEHRGHWRKGLGGPQAARTLAAEALERLVALHLVRRTADGVLPLPAIARYGAVQAEPSEK